MSILRILKITLAFIGLIMLIALGMAFAPEVTKILLGVLCIFGIGYIYFLPTIIANKRNHRQHDPISIINLFFGWTFIGWVACLAWATSNQSR